MTISPEVMSYIVEQCKDPDSGGRMVDNIITSHYPARPLTRGAEPDGVSNRDESRRGRHEDGKIGYDFS